MTAVVSTLAPVFALILFGWLVARLRLVPDAFWPPAETLTYYVFFPALLVVGAARAEVAPAQMVPMVTALVLAVLVVAGCVWLARPRLGLAPEAFTSVFQGTIRPNTYLGVAAAVLLLGDAGLALFSVCLVFVVPLVNLLSVLVFVRVIPPNEAGESRGWRRALIPIVTNPLILGCLIGYGLNLSGLGLPPVVGPLLDILGRAALPIGLLAVGAGLEIAAAGRALRLVFATQVMKLGLLPLMTFGLCMLFNAEPTAMATAVLYATLPVSPISYVLARQMGGDATLMAGIITVSTLFAMVVMPTAMVLMAIPT